MIDLPSLPWVLKRNAFSCAVSGRNLLQVRDSNEMLPVLNAQEDKVLQV